MEQRIEHTGTLITLGGIRRFWIVLLGLAIGFLVLVVPLPYLIGVLITLIAALLILQNPYWGLVAYMVVFLVRPQEIWTTFGGQLPIEKTLAIAVLISTIVSPKVRVRNKIVLTPTSVAMLAFAGVIFMSVPVAVWRGGAMTGAMEFAKIAIVFFLITQLCDTPKRIQILVWVYLLCHLWIAGSTIYNYYTEPAYIRMGIQRARAYALTMGDPNSVAASIAFSVPFALMMLKSSRGFLTKAVLLFLVVLSAYGIIFTGSRSGMVTLIVLAFLAAFRSRHKLPALLVTVGVLLSVWTIMPEQYQKRFMTIFEPEGEQAGARESALGRWRGLRLGVKMFLDRPILGVGVGMFPAAWFSEYTIDGHHDWSQPHNMFAQLISELGTIGLISFTVFVFLLFRQNHRVLEMLRRFTRPPPDLAMLQQIAGAVGIALILLMISGLFGHNLYRYNWYFYAGLVVAMETVLLAYQKKTSPPVAEVTRT